MFLLSVISLGSHNALFLMCLVIFYCVLVVVSEKLLMEFWFEDQIKGAFFQRGHEFTFAKHVETLPVQEYFKVDYDLKVFLSDSCNLGYKFTKRLAMVTMSWGKLSPPYIQCNTKLTLLGISWEKVVYFWFILIIAIWESMTNIEKAF